MTIKLIQIGNSKGLRLPKNIIVKYNLKEVLEIFETDEGILIKPASEVRKEWDAQFKRANASDVPDDDFSDFMSASSEFDRSEWKW